MALSLSMLFSPRLTAEENTVSILTVRGLDEDLVRQLHKRAAEHGRTAEAEHREILRQALISPTQPSRADIAGRLAAFRKVTGSRTAGSAADLLAKARRDRGSHLSGQDGDA